MISRASFLSILSLLIVVSPTLQATVAQQKADNKSREITWEDVQATLKKTLDHRTPEIVATATFAVALVGALVAPDDLPARLARLKPLHLKYYKVIQYLKKNVFEFGAAAFLASIGYRVSTGGEIKIPSPATVFNAWMEKGAIVSGLGATIMPKTPAKSEVISEKDVAARSIVKK